MSSDLFDLTPEEQARLDSPVFRGTTVEGWRALGASMSSLVVDAVAEGDLSIERAIYVMSRATLGCDPKDRITLRAISHRRLELLLPSTGRVDRRRVPSAIKRSAVGLIDMLRHAHPKEPIVPKESASTEVEEDATTWLLDEALRWLKALGMAPESLKPRSLYYDWYLPTKRAMEAEEAAVTAGDDPAETPS